MKITLYILSILLALPLLSFGESRGISVTPDQIVVDSVDEWPFVTELHVANTGTEDEWIEVSVFGAVESISIEPSRFVVGAGQSQRVVMTISKNDKIIGLLKIAATRTTVNGAQVGSGVEIPIAVSSGAVSVGDMRQAAAAGSTDSTLEGAVFTLLLGGAAIFFILVLARRMVSY